MPRIISCSRGAFVLEMDETSAPRAMDKAIATYALLLMADAEITLPEILTGQKRWEPERAARIIGMPNNRPHEVAARLNAHRETIHKLFMALPADTMRSLAERMSSVAIERESEALDGRANRQDLFPTATALAACR